MEVYRVSCCWLAFGYSAGHAGMRQNRFKRAGVIEVTSCRLMTPERLGGAMRQLIGHSDEMLRLSRRLTRVFDWSKSFYSPDCPYSA